MLGADVVGGPAASSSTVADPSIEILPASTSVATSSIAHPLSASSSSAAAVAGHAPAAAALKPKEKKSAGKGKATASGTKHKEKPSSTAKTKGGTSSVKTKAKSKTKAAKPSSLPSSSSKGPEVAPTPAAGLATKSGPEDDAEVRTTSPAHRFYQHCAAILASYFFSLSLLALSQITIVTAFWFPLRPLVLGFCSDGVARGGAATLWFNWEKRARVRKRARTRRPRRRRHRTDEGEGKEKQNGKAGVIREGTGRRKIRGGARK